MFQFFLGRKAVGAITANGNCVVAPAVCEATAIKKSFANGSCVAAPAVCEAIAVKTVKVANGDCVVAPAVAFGSVSVGEWTNHLRLKISNPSTLEQTDYTTRIYLDGNVDSEVADFIAAGESDGSDLLVVWNGVPIDFVRMIWDKSGSVARLFVEIPTIPALGDTYLDLYIGNPDAIDLNNMHSVGALAISDFNSLVAPTRHQDPGTGPGDRISGLSDLQLASGKLLRAYHTNVQPNTDLLDSSIDNGDSWTNIATLPENSNGELSLARIDSDNKIWLLYTTSLNVVSITESIDEGLNWSTPHVIANEQGGGATLLYKSPTDIFAFFPNETTGVMECWKSTGAYNSWAYVEDVGAPINGRFEDPTSIVRKGVGAGDLILFVEDEPGSPGDISNNDVRGYISKNDGVDWLQLSPIPTTVIPPGDNEPGSLTYATLNSGAEELRFYFSTSAYNQRGNSADYATSFIGYVTIDFIDSTNIEVGPFGIIKVTEGRNTDPPGGVGVEGLSLQSGELLISWVSFSTQINFVYQIKMSPDTEGIQNMYSFLEQQGVMSGNTVDSNDGFCLEATRNELSGRQYAQFPLDTAYSNLSVEVDFKIPTNAGGAVIDLIEDDVDIMRESISSHVATVQYKPGEICYTAGGGVYNSLDIVTTWTEQTWYNARYDLIDGTTTLIQKTFISEVEKSADDNTGTRVVGIDEVRLNVDNWVLGKVYWNNLVVREITDVGDVIIGIDKVANGACTVAPAVCEGTAEVVGFIDADGDCVAAPAVCSGVAELSGKIAADGDCVVAPAVCDGTTATTQAIDANGDCVVAPAVCEGTALVLGLIIVDGDCVAAPAVCEGVAVKGDSVANGDCVAAPAVCEAIAVKTAKTADGDCVTAPAVCDGVAITIGFIIADGDCVAAPAVCLGTVIVRDAATFLYLCAYDKPELILTIKDELDPTLSILDDGDTNVVCEPEFV